VRGKARVGEVRREVLKLRRVKDIDFGFKVRLSLSCGHDTDVANVGAERYLGMLKRCTKCASPAALRDKSL
jgi:hypothetical protein